MLGATVAALLCLAIPLAGQENPTLSRPLAENEVTRASVQARITALANLETGDPALRKELEASYREALLAMDAIDAARVKVAKFDELKSKGPRQIELARAYQAPVVDAGALRSLETEDVTSRLRLAKASAEAAVAAVRKADREIGDVTAQQTQLPKSLADAEKAVRERESELAASATSSTDPMRGAAMASLATARLVLAKLERDAIQAEMATGQIAMDLAVAEKARAEAESKSATSLSQALQDVLGQRMQVDAERLVILASNRLRDLQTKNSVLQAAAKDSLDYARKRKALQLELPRIRARIDAKQKLLAETKKRLVAVRRMVRVGMTQTTGDLLRQQKTRLPDVTSYRVQSRSRQDVSTDMRVEQLKINELLAQEEDRFIALVLADPAGDEQGLESLARTVHRELTETLTKLQQDYDEKLNEIARLETEDLLLTQLAEEFETFIDEKILWIRSTVPIWAAEFRRLPELIASIPAIDLLGSALIESLVTHWVQLSGLVLIAAALLFLRRRLKSLLANFSAEAERPVCVSIRPTVLAVLVCVVLAAPLTILLLGCSLLCRNLDIVSLVGPGLASGFMSAAGLGLALETFRRICAKNGVASTHIGWDAVSVVRLRRALTFLLWIGVPTLLAIHAADGGNPYVRSIVGRSVFLAGWCVAAAVLVNLLRPGRTVLQAMAGGTRVELGRLRHVAFLLAIALPVSLVILAAAGYYFTARQLSGRVMWTVAFVFALLVASGIVNRWQLVSRRRLAIRQRRERAEAARALAEAEGSSTAAPPAPPAENTLDVAEVSAQVRKLSRAAFVVVGCMTLFAVWVDVLPALGGLRDIDVWSSTGTVTTAPGTQSGVAPPPSAAPATGETPTVAPQTDRISLADLLLCLIVIVLTTVAAKNIPGLLKLSLLQHVRHGNQYAIATLVQYGIVILGVVLAFGAIGIGWSKVQWLIAAVSLGLGFGLQEIFANFVSGLILLFERPIRVGDFVTVGDVKGEVTRIRIRATTIRNLERQELIVPNKEFITGQVINWTLTDTVVRMVIHVGIAYGSDVQLAQQVLLRLADENQYVIAEPKPKALFKQFGDSSLVFELRIFIRDLDHWPKVLDSMHQAIDREFRAAGIEIAFPQRDLHLRSAQEPLHVRLHPEDPAAADSDDRPEGKT